MGFSPGSFKTRDGQNFHFEQKDGRVVLWDECETLMLLDLDAENARKAAEQLDLAANLANEFSPSS